MTTSDNILCVDCGSTNDAGAKACWLCGQPLTPANSVVVPADAPAEAVVKEEFDTTSLMIVVTVIAVGVGLGATEPGLLIPYVIVSIPALVSTFKKTRKRAEENRPMRPAEKVLAFFVSTATVVAIIIGIQIAIVIAVALVCAAICYSGGFTHF